VALEGRSIGPGGDGKPHGRGPSVAQAWAQVSNAVRRLSPKARFALSLAFLAAILLAFSAFLFLPSATLKVACRHDFRSADLTLSIDGEVVRSDTVTGAPVRKWFGVVEKTEGTYTTTVPVSSGRHVVGVRLRATGFDRTRTIPGEFSRGQESTLSVDTGRDLSLAWRSSGSGASAAEPASSVPWLKYTGSILMTIFGSIVSASIGVLVQDFLRSRKARLAEGGELSPPSSKAAS
jgi:hypothetical protein